MAPFATLHCITSFPHPRVLKSLAVAKINNLDLHVPQDLNFGVTNQTPAFLSKWPMGKVPTLETASGFLLSEASAIAFYLAEAGPKKDQLLGVDIESRARTQQWICFGDSELLPIPALVSEILGRGPYNALDWEGNLAALHRALRVLDGHLEGREWLVGERLSLADLSVASPMYMGLKFVVDAEMREKYKALTQWYLRVAEADGVKESFPELEMVQKLVKPEGRRN